MAFKPTLLAESAHTAQIALDEIYADHSVHAKVTALLIGTCFLVDMIQLSPPDKIA